MTAALSSIEPRLVDRRIAARYLGNLCVKTIANLVKRGLLREVRIGGRELYDLEDLNRLVDAQKSAAPNRSVV
jgi:hypothetical protein